ncbi:hypothetical protein [uncultured Jatrophihabitans sp.]|uniref:hypothetical protein n=1 Tax=uncultured Jatrophihabitans sp. TaxID=1610747 RepID=UPI0035CB4091
MAVPRARIVAALLAVCTLLAGVLAGTTPAQAHAVIPTNLPAPDVHGPVIVTPHLTYWVPQVDDANPCQLVSLGNGDHPCFGYVQLGARIRGLRPGVPVTAQFTLHYNESFVCTNWTTLVKDPRPDRRVTLHGDGATQGTYLAGPPPATTTSWGRATVSAFYFAHSPNLRWPDLVDLKCGAGEAVERSGFVLSRITVQVTLLNPRGQDIGDYPTVPVKGSYTASPYDFASGAQPPFVPA